MTVGEGVPVRGEKVEKMNTEMMLVGLFLACLMTEKTTRRFGQMTLDLGGKALEYLKTDPKGITRDVHRVEWMNKHHAEALGYTMPPWVIPKTESDQKQFPSADRVHDVAIVHDVNENIMPLLVYQSSALRGLDEVLANAQRDGALVEDDGKRLLLDMGEGMMEISFVRNHKAGKFARFVVREI